MARRLPQPEDRTNRLPAEAAQVTQDDAAVMAAIEERTRVAAQTAAAAPKRLGGGLAHTQAAFASAVHQDQSLQQHSQARTAHR